MATKREDEAAYMRSYYKRRRQEDKEWAIALLGGKCTKCGSFDNLEFDHIDPSTKLFNVGSHFGRYSREKLGQEMEKCQLLCSTCHKGRTGYAEHGTRASYVGGCRCTECTTANREYYPDYWSKKRTAEA